jgi:hypothetical protein
MSVRIKTYAPTVKTGIQNATASGLKRATVFLHSKCREITNTPNTGVRVSAKDVHRQAAEQLKGADVGLVKVKATRKFKGGQTEEVEGHYWYDKKNFADTLNPRTGKVSKVRSVTIYPYPSKPGEAPRKRSGWGQRHIVWEFDSASVAGRVGVSTHAIYMLFLELGTRFMKRRPWLVVTLMKNMKMIGLLACTGKPDRPVSNGQGGLG